MGIHHVFGDESSTNGPRYTLFGAITLQAAQLTQFNSAVTAFRNNNRLWSSLKWENVTDYMEDYYKQFINLFFDSDCDIKFKTLVINFEQLDHQAYNFGDRELGHYKFLYTFLLNSFCRKIDTDDGCIVRIHHRTKATPRLQKVQLYVNRKMGKQSIREISPIRLSSSNELQLADVLMGGIAYRLNGLHERSSQRASKYRLSQYILDRARIRNIYANSSIFNQRFNVWHLTPYALNRKSP